MQVYVLPLETQLAMIQEGEDLDSINWFNPTTCLCLSQPRTLTSLVICHDLYVQ
jgi:hypothetical protein